MEITCVIVQIENRITTVASFIDSTHEAVYERGKARYVKLLAAQLARIGISPRAFIDPDTDMAELFKRTGVAVGQWHDKNSKTPHMRSVIGGTHGMVQIDLLDPSNIDVEVNLPGNPPTP